MLSEPQIARYARQLLVRGISGKGQERLLASRALLVGAGPVAESCAAYLAAAGVGRIEWVSSELVRFDEPLFLLEAKDAAAPRQDAARRAVKRLNSEVTFGAGEGDPVSTVVVEIAPSGSVEKGSRIRVSAKDGRAAIARGSCAGCLSWGADPLADKAPQVNPSDMWLRPEDVPHLALNFAASAAAGSLAATEAIAFLLGEGGLEGHALWLDLLTGMPRREKLPGCAECSP